MNVLVVAAHPDDEVLGCSGTVARLAADGHSVYIGILGEGITSRYQNPDDADASEIKALHSSSLKVAKLLGAKEPILHRLPDNRFDSVDLLDIVKIVEDMVVELKPEVLYTHHGGDLNIDHELTHRAVMTATRPLADCPVRDIYAFEIPSSTEWAFQRFKPAFHPNVFVDIKSTLETKLQAMEIYDGEMRPFPHPRSAEALRAIAQRWGSVVGFEAAEPFELIRSVRP